VNPRLLVPAAALVALAASHASAQTDTTAAEPLQDNSFLVEEAYNQEPGVVQHISTFVHGRDDTWAYSFTQEWPMGSLRNQFSYTLPIAHAGGETGIGDVMVNYRYQWIGDGDAAVAVSPRLSAVIPTGSAEKGFGQGGFGVQGALPVSVVLVKDVLVSHSNAGVTYTPRAQDAVGNREATTSVFLAQSAVWLVRPMFNVLVEGVWARNEFVSGVNATDAEESAVISPGVRFGINLPSGLQIVPGVAVPFGVGPSAGQRSLFLYLSFEHAFKRTR
jgi:hypothetical protein